MIEKIIADNASEKITVKWDGTRFAIIQSRERPFQYLDKAVIILNPREMLDIVKFASNLGGGE